MRVLRSRLFIFYVYMLLFMFLLFFRTYSHTWEFCIPDVHILRLYAVIYVIILRNALPYMRVLHSVLIFYVYMLLFMFLLFFGTRRRRMHIYKRQLSINGCMRTSNLLDYVCAMLSFRVSLFSYNINLHLCHDIKEQFSLRTGNHPALAKGWCIQRLLHFFFFFFFFF